MSLQETKPLTRMVLMQVEQEYFKTHLKQINTV